MIAGIGRTRRRARILFLIATQLLFGISPLCAQVPDSASRLSGPEDFSAIPSELSLLEELPGPTAPTENEIYSSSQQLKSFDTPTDGSSEVGHFSDLPMPAEGTSAMVDSSGHWLQAGRWITEADAVFLHRTIHDQIALSGDVFSGRRMIIRQGSRDVAPTLRLTIGRNLFRDQDNRDHSVRFTFYGLSSYVQSQTIESLGVNGIFIIDNPTISSAFNGAQTQSFRWQSSFNSFELNYHVQQRLRKDQMVLNPDGEWIRRANSGVTYSMLAGIRVFALDEELAIFTENDTATETGSLKILTHSDLVGFQFGGGFAHQFDHWNWGVRGKAGAFLNFSEQETDLIDSVNAALTRTEQETNMELAFVGQMSIFSTFYLRPNFSLRVAYEALWLNSVALAPEQIGFAVGRLPTVVSGGATFYQGVSAGLELVW